MKLQRSIITASTPQTITTVQTVTGKVWHVSPPTSVILTLEDGTNQSFKIPKGQKFTIDGQEVDAFGLRKGMVVTATKIVEVPEVVVSQRKYVSGTMPAGATRRCSDADRLGRANVFSEGLVSSGNNACSRNEAAEDRERLASGRTPWVDTRFCFARSKASPCRFRTLSNPTEEALRL